MRAIIASCCVMFDVMSVLSDMNSFLMHVDQARVFERLSLHGDRLLPFIWNIYVYDDAVENAYCNSDGTIVITEGMMRLFKNEDELAAVVSHEMGHLIAKHKGSTSPEKEMEADIIGLELMARAGYDPNAAVEFWTRYYEHIGWWEGDGTHQEPHERIEMLKKLTHREFRK